MYAGGIAVIPGKVWQHGLQYPGERAVVAALSKYTFLILLTSYFRMVFQRLDVQALLFVILRHIRQGGGIQHLVNAALELEP